MDISGADSGSSSTLAIDDIHFQSNCYRPASTANTCPQNQIKCPKNFCIDRYTLCDSVNDCGDQWDESAVNCRRMNITRCSFETSLGTSACKYTLEQDRGSSTQWRLIKATTASTSNNMARMTGPMIDHTYKLATM